MHGRAVVSVLQRKGLVWSSSGTPYRTLFWGYPSPAGREAFRSSPNLLEGYAWTHLC
jgi:uncharacterized protein YjhX (UPF0386 family)